MTKPLAAVVLECCARIRDAVEIESAETGEPCIDGEGLERALADLEFAARNELEER